MDFVDNTDFVDIQSYNRVHCFNLQKWHIYAIDRNDNSLFARLCTRLPSARTAQIRMIAETKMDFASSEVILYFMTLTSKFFFVVHSSLFILYVSICDLTI